MNSYEGLIKLGLNNDPEFTLDIPWKDLSLDAVRESNILGLIPGVSYIQEVAGYCATVKEVWFVKKLIVFMNELHDGKLDKEKFDNFMTEYNSDEKYRKKIVELIVVAIDNYTSAKKALIMANLFKAYVNGCMDIDWLAKLCTVLDQMNIDCIEKLDELSKLKTPYQHNNPAFDDGFVLLISAGLGALWGSRFIVNVIGRCLHYHGILGECNITVPEEIFVLSDIFEESMANE